MVGRSRFTRSSAVVLVAVVSALAAGAPAGASARCSSSLPERRHFADGAADAGLGLAPEVRAVDVRLDGACRLRVEPTLGDRDRTVGLFPREGVAIYLDTDGSSLTGAPSWAGADVAVVSAGHLGARDLGPALGRWDGTTFSFEHARTLRDVGIGGFSATLDQLGIAAPATLGLRAGTSWVGLLGIYRDFAPDPGAPSYALPLSFGGRSGVTVWPGAVI